MPAGTALPEVGQQAPPAGGYTIERFEGYLDRLSTDLKSLPQKDARSIFELTYLVFSRQILAALKARRFEDMAWTTDMACRFVEVYWHQRSLWERRDPSLCRAWRVAFQAMEDGRLNSLQAMLLGINAHINYDLSFVTLGASRHAGDLASDDATRTLSMTSTGLPTVRYRDFLVINQIEWEAIAPVQDAVLKANSRLLYWANRLTMRGTRFLGQRVLMEARDTAWYQMMLLVHARDDDERAIVARLIDAHAAGIADLVLALSPRPDEVVKNTVGWIRRGERIDPQLQSSLIALVRNNPVVADLGLRQLAFTGADPVSVLLTLHSGGDVRAAGLFGRMVLAVAPRHAKVQLVRFLAKGSEQSLAILDALLHDGLSTASLPRESYLKRSAPLDEPIAAVCRRWSDQLARNHACMNVPEVAANQTLVDALDGHADSLRTRLTTLERSGARGGPAPPSPSLALQEASRFLASHPDRWVRTCAQADPALGSASPAADGETIMTIIERVLFLKETQVFVEVDVPSLVHVAESLEHRTYGPGQVLVHRGRHSGGLHVVFQGSVEVIQQRDGADVVIARLGPHDAIGELSALNDTPATADCRALTHVEAYFLPTAVLTNLLHQHPRIAIGFIRMLSLRLVDTTLRVSAVDAASAPPA